MKSHPLVIILLLLAILSSSAEADVYINEVELNPEHWSELFNLGDEDDFDEEQWIELFNDGDDEVDLSGWSIVPLSDPNKEIVIPEWNLSPQDFYVISVESDWLDWRDETLILLNHEGKEMDRTPPLQDLLESDCTWGRYPDGSPQWMLQDPTWYGPSSGKLCELTDRGS